MIFLHNPRCSKSREGLKLLNENNISFEILKYLEKDLSVEFMKNLISKLKIKPIEIVRTNEKIWKEKYKNKQLNEDEVIEILVKEKKLIQRPILINNNKAVIGRPAEELLKII